MPTYVHERIFSALDRTSAKALVDEINAVLDAKVSRELEDDVAATTSDLPQELAGLTVVSMSRLRQDEAVENGGRSYADVYDDLEIEVESATPPTAAGARERAVGTGYAESSFVLEAAALKRLASCRTTIALRYPGSLYDNRAFVAVRKLIFERVGDAVVESGEGTRFETSETFVANLARQFGGRWAKTAMAGASPKAAPPKKVRRPCVAKPGEIESIAIYELLESLVAGDDPFAREALKKALVVSSDAVRAYAAALLERGGEADAALAKVLGCGIPEVVEARWALDLLLRRVVED